MTDKARWLFLVYKVPSEPSARRVYVWRKLKRLGAMLLHDSIWVLPANPRTQEHLQWLAAEIIEMEGDAQVWEATPLLAGQEEALIGQFMAEVESAYREILSALEQPEADAASLAQRYQQIKASDYFNSELGEQVREALIRARGEPGQ